MTLANAPSLRQLSSVLPAANYHHQLDSTEAARILESIGFKVVRTKNHYIYEREEIKLTLPSTGRCNNALSKIVLRLQHQHDAAQQEPKLRLIPQPLEISHRGENLVVVGDAGASWRVRTHDGSRPYLVSKEESGPAIEVQLPMPTFIDSKNGELPLTDEPVPALEPAETPASAGERPAPVYTPLTNQSDVAALVRLTQRRLESLEVKREQLHLQLATIDRDRDAAVGFLATLGINDVPPAPKRTVLPSPSQRGKTTVSQAERDKIKMALADIGGPSAGAAALQNAVQQKFNIVMTYPRAYYWIKNPDKL